jgi:hypothetical protein
MRCDARDAMRGPMRCDLVAMQCAALRCTVRGLFAMQCAMRGLVAFARCGSCGDGSRGAGSRGAGSCGGHLAVDGRGRRQLLEAHAAGGAQPGLEARALERGGAAGRGEGDGLRQAAPCFLAML